MRSILFALGVLAMLTTTHAAFAGETSCGGTFTELAKSKYLRDFNEPTNEPVSQPDLNLSCSNGWGVDYWNSTSLTRGLNSGAAENDFCGSKTGTTDWFKYNTGLCFYDIVFGAHNKTWQIGSGDLFMPYVELASPKELVWGSQRLTPFVRFELYQGVGGALAKADIVPYLGVYHAWQIRPNLTINNRWFVMKTPNALGAHSGFHFTGESQLDWDLNKRWTIIFPYVKYAMMIQAPTSDHRNNQFAGGGGFQYHFQWF